MAYMQPPRIKWDRAGPRQGVTIQREIGGIWYAWRIPFNGLVTQALAAELLDVSLMTVNNWVRTGKLQHVKIEGQPSLISLRQIKNRRALLEAQRHWWRGRSG